MGTDEAVGFQQLHTTLVDRLGSDIVAGRIPVGTRILADEMVAQHGMSRTVVREVVRVLESMGLVAVRRRVGITVQPSTCWNPLDTNIVRWQLAGPGRFDQLRALSELRSGIEPLAARLAAERATPDQCGALTAAVVGMSATSRAADGAAYLAHDADFHRTLLAASGNSMLRGMSDIVVEVLAGRTRHSLMPHVAEPEAIRLHGVVASAIQARDGEAAQEAMQEIVSESAAAVAVLGADDPSDQRRSFT